LHNAFEKTNKKIIMTLMFCPLIAPSYIKHVKCYLNFRHTLQQKQEKYIINSFANVIKKNCTEYFEYFKSRRFFFYYLIFSRNKFSETLQMKEVHGLFRFPIAFVYMQTVAACIVSVFCLYMIFFITVSRLVFVMAGLLKQWHFTTST
jgi:hypothetical protein